MHSVKVQKKIAAGTGGGMDCQEKTERDVQLVT